MEKAHITIEKLTLNHLVIEKQWRDLRTSIEKTIVN